MVGADDRQVVGAQRLATARPGVLRRAAAAASSRRTWRPRSSGATSGPRATGRGTAGRSRRTRSSPRSRAAADARHCLLGGHVHDVERRAGHAGQHDRPVGGLRLESPTAGSARGSAGRCRRAASACATSTSIAMPFSACIMISAPLLAACLHRPQDLAVVGVEDARIGHEQLEAGDALGRPARPSP